MSSLMQHRGRIKNNKVELFMYLVKDIDVPAKCMWCGVAYDMQKKPHVCVCGRAITHIFLHGPNQNETIELYKEWLVRTKCIAYKLLPNESNSCYVSSSYGTVDAEEIELTRPNKSIAKLPKLYRIWRTPVDMFGCWVRFKWDGKLHAPDLSVPISVYKLPEDAKPLTDEEAAQYWFST